MAKKYVAMDGNEAVAYVAYRYVEFIQSHLLRIWQSGVTLGQPRELKTFGVLFPP